MQKNLKRITVILLACTSATAFAQAPASPSVAQKTPSTPSVAAVAPTERVVSKELTDADKTATEVARLTSLIKLMEAEKTFEDKKAELEKTRALLASQRPAPRSAQAATPVQPPAETPMVVAIEGLNGALKTRLSYAAGGFLSAKVGDTLPSGQLVIAIAPSRVMVRDRSGSVSTLPMALSSNTGSLGSAPASTAPLPQHSPQMMGRFQQQQQQQYQQQQPAQPPQMPQQPPSMPR
jgi:type IV pilus biogenesis protein PilP